jgi:catechol 2,3-dioxygenase-like lactoylglutathione lyase family enzyme
MSVGPVDRVWFWVADMDRAVAFYTDVLGLGLEHRHGNEWTELKAGPVRLALHGAAEGREHPPGGVVVFEVDDLDASRFALEMRGVVFDPHVGEVEGRARFASFTDPDGNRLQILEYYEEH